MHDSFRFAAPHFRLWYAIAVLVATQVPAEEALVEWQEYTVEPGLTVESATGPAERYAPISVHFNETPLLEAATELSGHMQRNIVLDPRLNAEQVTVITHHPIPRFQARALLESLLHSRGLLLVENLGGELLEIRTPDQAMEKLNIVTRSDAPTPAHQPPRRESLAMNAGVIRIGNAWLTLGGPDQIWSGSRSGIYLAKRGTNAATPGQTLGSNFVLQRTQSGAIRVEPADIPHLVSPNLTETWSALTTPGKDVFTLLLIRLQPVPTETEVPAREDTAPGPG